MQTEPIHVICYGDSGAGKSTFAATFPRPLRVWLFDEFGKSRPYRASGGEVEDYVDDFGTNCTSIDAGTDKQVVIEKYFDFDPSTGESSGFHRFLQRRERYLRSKAWQDDATLVVDSVTFMELAARKYDQHVTNKTARDPRQWFAASTDALEDTLMVKLMGLPINVVVLAHIDEERDEVHGAMVFNPSAPGRLKKRLPSAYGEFYRAYATRDEAGDPAWALQTRSDRRYNAASQIGAPNPCYPHYQELWIPPAL